MKLIRKSNGKVLKVGAPVIYNGEKCTIANIKGANIEIERNFDGFSWNMVEPERFGAIWNEEDFVSHFFNQRELLAA